GAPDLRVRLAAEPVERPRELDDAAERAAAGAVEQRQEVRELRDARGDAAGVRDDAGEEILERLLRRGGAGEREVVGVVADRARAAARVDRHRVAAVCGDRVPREREPAALPGEVDRVAAAVRVALDRRVAEAAGEREDHGPGEADGVEHRAARVARATRAGA